ncbi:MAG: phosphoglycerate kinase [Oceanicoccus sp.]|jgi:phosphoglycerate kinase
MPLSSPPEWQNFNPSLMQLKTIQDLDLKGKRVLIRADLNVPLKNGQVQDDTRIQALIPTLKLCVDKGAKVILMTHLGRPKGAVVDSLKTDVLLEGLEELSGKKISKVDGCVEDFVSIAVDSLEEGEVLLLENTRFYPEEKYNDSEFSKKLAGLADLYINDAFGAAHRAHASTQGVTEYLPSYAGLLMAREVEVLSQVLGSPKGPVCLLVGGAKIDTKIGVLQHFLKVADYFLIGGALANTFLAAEGFDVGSSLYQEDKIQVARDFLLSAESKREFVYLPVDVIVADEISNDAEALDIKPEGVEGSMKILDLGSLTIETFKKCIAEAGTIIWNGPMGLYEFAPFEAGTREIVKAIVESNADSIVGGGDSIDAIKKYGYGQKDFTHISTGGGAMLEFLEGKKLPALVALKA